MIRWLPLLVLLAPAHAHAQEYPDDDAHNHDGSHDGAKTDCGTDYYLPGVVARLGSHSFMILGKDGPEHVIVEHRSGTPPHNYQFLLRVRLDPDELAAYEKIAAESKTLPAFTTIDFDDQKKQRGRTFFCLADLPKIFGKARQRGDAFEKLFPIKASLQKDADHEGSFEIGKSVVVGAYFTIARADVELLLYRYLPGYLAQDELKKALKERPGEIRPRLEHSPVLATEPEATAKAHVSYARTDGKKASLKTCPKSFHLKKTPMPETIHGFVLLADAGPNRVLAVHYYDEAPQNFQTALILELDDEGTKVWKKAGAGALLLSKDPFCMETIKKAAPKIRGTIYAGSTLDDYRLGTAIGEVLVKRYDVLVNRRLESFMPPLAVAASVE
jgi:hypothetical protein